MRDSEGLLLLHGYGSCTRNDVLDLQLISARKLSKVSEVTNVPDARLAPALLIFGYLHHISAEALQENQRELL